MSSKISDDLPVELMDQVAKKYELSKEPLQVDLPIDDLELLDTLAHNEGITLDELIRRIVHEWAVEQN